MAVQFMPLNFGQLRVMPAFGCNTILIVHVMVTSICIKHCRAYVLNTGLMLVHFCCMCPFCSARHCTVSIEKNKKSEFPFSSIINCKQPHAAREDSNFYYTAKNSGWSVPLCCCFRPPTIRVYKILSGHHPTIESRSFHERMPWLVTQWTQLEIARFAPARNARERRTGEL